MGDLESLGGPPVPEAGGRNSEFSRSRLGVGVWRGWSNPSSEKKRSANGDEKSGHRHQSELGAGFQTRRSINSTAMVAGSNIYKFKNPRVAAYLTTSVVMPSDSEVVTPVSVRSSLGIRPGLCSLMESCTDLTEDYGVLVGRTLVDASSWSASVLMVNPSSDVIHTTLFLVCGELGPGVGSIGGSCGVL